MSQVLPLTGGGVAGLTVGIIMQEVHGGGWLTALAGVGAAIAVAVWWLESRLPNANGPL